MTVFSKFDDFSYQLALGLHDLDGDTLKVYLTDATPNPVTNTKKADLASITPQNGYAAADIQNSLATLTGTTSMSAIDVAYTATGGSFGPFRYAVVYNETNIDDALVGYIDFGSEITITTGNTININFSDPLIVLGFS